MFPIVAYKIFILVLNKNNPILETFYIFFPKINLFYKTLM